MLIGVGVQFSPPIYASLSEGRAFLYTGICGWAVCLLAGLLEWPWESGGRSAAPFLRSLWRAGQRETMGS